jgi:ABC-type polysaccharide/polyol phosphate transport system ATPase subunit
VATTDALIEVESLAKRYRVGRRERRRTTLKETLGHALSRRPSNEDPGWLWALDQISFTVAPGEILGIVGSNGAGKSTLLRVLAGVTPPTRGQVALYGRQTSLLDVGAGFHPELSGLENIFLVGAILGLRRQQIQSELYEIVGFSGIDHQLRMPVKRYSSGMIVRLCFSIAIQLRPEILLVDEVLSMGDERFRHQCFHAISARAAQGTAVLIVSHSMETIAALAKSVLWLEGGRQRQLGPADGVIAAYLDQAKATQKSVE